MARTLILHPPTPAPRAGGSVAGTEFVGFADLGALELAALLSRSSPNPGDVKLLDAFALDVSSLRRSAVRRLPGGGAELGASVEDLVAALPERFGTPVSAVVACPPALRVPTRDAALGALLVALRTRGVERLILADCAGEADGPPDQALALAVFSAYPELDAYVAGCALSSVPALLDRLVAGVHLGQECLGVAPFPAWELVDTVAYQRFHADVITELGGALAGWSFLGAPGLNLPVRLPLGAVPAAQLRAEYAAALTPYVRLLASGACAPPGGAHTPLRLCVLAQTREWSAQQVEALLGAFHQVVRAEAGAASGSLSALRLEFPHGLNPGKLGPAQLEQLRGHTSGLVLRPPRADVAMTDFVELARLSEAASGAEVPLQIEYPIGLAGQSREDINQLLVVAMDLWDRFRAYPVLALPAAQAESEVPRAILEDFLWTVERRLRASSGPEKVIMNLTYACNNHCTFCAVGTRTQFHGHTDSQREHLLEYRARGVTMVDFDGGEPTLHPDLIGTVRYARSIGYERINVTTNGRLAFYEPYARKLVRSGLTTLLFSVHGPDAKSHAQQVGVAEAFEQTTGGIRNCVKFAPRGVELGMNVTLTKSNTQKLEALMELAWDLGLRWINIQFLTPFGRATRMIAPDTEYAAEVARGVIDRWRDRMKVQIINLPFCFMPGYEDHLEGDLLKLARHMIFVNNEDVNLADYLAERRVRKPVCEGCTRAVFCGGFYELESVPEPPWLVAPEDLIKKRGPSAEDAAE